MNIQLSDHFTYSRLLRFVIPSIVMMIFTSIYSVVDGLFISNFVGKTPFAAVNLIMPFAMLLGGFGFMIGTGGSALVGKTLGEGDREKANQIFSLLIYVSIGLGAVLAVFGIVFIKPISVLLGADEQMLGYCVVYCRILMLALPGFMLQNVFQSFLITAEKPAMGLVVTVIAGVTNMVLDALFIAFFRWGGCRCCGGNGDQPMCGRYCSILLFSAEKRQLAAADKDNIHGAGAAAVLQ